MLVMDRHVGLATPSFTNTRTSLAAPNVPGSGARRLILAAACRNRPAALASLRRCRILPRLRLFMSLTFLSTAGSEARA